MFSSTSVSSVMMALVSILPSPWIFAPFTMFTPETAYHSPLYSSVEETESPKPCRVFMGTKTAKKSFPQTSNAPITLSRNLPVTAGKSAGIVNTAPSQTRLQNCLLQIVMVTFRIGSQNLPALAMTMFLRFRRISTRHNVKL